MALNFEVTAKDIRGRCGKLRVGDKTVKTPALLPVINPHMVPITPAEMRGLGVEALITNAYIISRSREFREKALSEGLHQMLGFDGVIMTDSGSFQLSVYGDVEVTNAETLLFQQAIGSDILVPLDIPTSPSADREQAEYELRVTLERLMEAKALLGDDAHIAGPVQGGRFPDLREEAGRLVGEIGFSLCPIGAVVPLMESYRYRDLVEVVTAAQKGIPVSSCVHLFGAGHPAMFALAVAMGCDIFDSAAYALYAKEGRYLTGEGSYRLQEIADLPCPCEVCRRHSAAEIQKSEDKERLLALHNLYQTLAEVSRVRQAVQDGVLWELVDDRCRGHPQLLRGFRELLRHADDLAPYDRVSKRRFFYRGSESCRRTEVLRYQSMLARLSLGEKVHVAFDGRTRPELGDLLLFKPPFGPYPPELKETFPIGQSEIPDWDEEMVRQGCRGIAFLAGSHQGIRLTVSCDTSWVRIVREEVPSAEVIDNSQI